MTAMMIVNHTSPAMRNLPPVPPRLVFALMCFVTLYTATRADDSVLSVYQRDVQPLLKTLCFRCHGADNEKGGLRLDQIDPDVIEGDDAEIWHDVLDQINLGEMPPPKVTQPTSEQRRVLIDWLGRVLRQAAEAQRFQEGRVSARRLTRYEYANTLRDLLGIELDFAADLPPEPVSSSGFLNDGATLEMSPTQIEIYLQIARRALGEVIVEGEPPQQFEFEQSSTAIGNLPTRKFAGHLPVNPEFVLDLGEFPRRGEFELNVTAEAATPNGEDLPRMRISMGHVPGIIHVPRGPIGEVAVSEGSNTYTFRGRMEDFPQPGPISFGNSGFKGMIVMIDFVDADGNELRYDDTPYAQKPPKPKKKKQDADNAAVDETAPPEPTAFGERLDIRVTSATFRAPIYASWPPENHRRLLLQSETGDEDRDVRDVVAAFMTQAFRRPITDDELMQTVALYDAIRQRSASDEEATRETFASILVSPHFLYLVESRPSQSSENRVTDWELASRLSYFLWSTAPDPTLRELAGKGELNQPGILRQQVERMLSDARSDEFIRCFVDQWLDLDALNRVAVNPEFFPEFDNGLKHQMRLETQAYFAEVLRHDRSALELIDSDWAMLNRPLAKHYGVKESLDGSADSKSPRGLDFERVDLNSTDRRGGLLWQAAFHLANSNGEDSHPIKRAVWILDRLLDSPPAPPPPEVPELDPDRPDLAKLTLKEQLAVHRAKESCASCHQGIDPWGIPLENFNAIGQWRSEVPAHRKRPRTEVDSQSVLPDGTSIQGVRELQRHLSENCRERFARSMVRRMMCYALGRSTDLGDREAVSELTEQFSESDFSLKSLITALVLSETFQSK